jgi:hypothetical protein
MLTHPDIGNAGRLGNALFQYAAVKGISKRLGYEPVLLKEVHNRVWDGQKCQLNYFNLDIRYIENSELSIFKYSFSEQTSRVFDRNIINILPNTFIFGHYENFRYFENVEKEIRKEFTLVPEIQLKGKEFLQNFEGFTTIGIHIRLGDYSDIYTSAYSNPSHWIHEFLENAISQFKDISMKRFICFTGGNKQDGQDNKDIDFVKTLITPHISNFTVSTDNPSIVDFSILTQIDHVIVLTFSTFIWWACFLNKNPKKKIIVPKNAMFAENTEFWHSSFIQI